MGSDPAIRQDCLKPPFWHQKVPAKPIFAHIYNNIINKNKNLTGSDPTIHHHQWQWRPDPTTPLDISCISAIINS